MLNVIRNKNEITNAKLRGVNTDLFTWFQVLREPLEVSWDASFHLLHLPSLFELVSRLQIVPSVSPHQCMRLRNDTDAIAPTESTDELDSLITICEIL